MTSDIIKSECGPRCAMHPSIWGPATWGAIHYIALGYPLSEPSPESRDAYSSFFTVLGPVLPCAMCSKHYQEHLSQNPVTPALDSREALFQWTVDLHNAVSQSIGKESWTYERAFTKYSGEVRAEPREARSRGGLLKVCTMVVSLLGSLALILWVLRRRSRQAMSLRTK